MIALTLALRNLWLNRRRSLATILAVAVGFTAINLFGGYIHDIYRGLKSSAIHGEGLGHLTVARNGFFAEGALHPERYSLKGDELKRLLSTLESTPGVKLATPRIGLSGLISNGRISTIFIGEGQVPQDMAKLGQPHKLDPKHPVGGLMSSGLGQLLGVKPGQTTVIMGSTLAGQTNALDFEVDGFFDDCQDMVKKAFLDESLTHKNLTSANSINIARWLPQMFYIFFAYKQLKQYNKSIVLSCPSGNFGNICAGIMAKRLGFPISRFVASTNANDTVPRFLENGNYEPKPSVATISNAMDVGNPSNFIRIQELYNNDLTEFEKDFSSYSFSDTETEIAIKDIYNRTKYIAEPHGAVGYLGLKKEMQKQPNSIGVFLETAHPIKFLDIVEPLLDLQLPIPKQIESVLNKEKVSVKIKTYEELKDFLH